MKRVLGLSLFLAASCFGGLGTPYVSMNLVAPADWSYWYATGSMTETADGLTSSSNGSLIYGLPTSPNYETRVHYKLTNSGGSYVTYFRATPDANLYANTGSFYATEISNINISGGNCSAVLTLWRRDASTNSLSTVYAIGIACSQEMDLSIVARDSVLVVYRPDTRVWLSWYTLPSYYPNPSQATSQMGVGVASTPTTSGITKADAYAIDTVAPNSPNPPMVSTSGTKVEMQWQGTIDAGAGLMFYQMWRRPLADPSGWVFRGHVTAPSFVDRDAITNGSTYVYLIRAIDWHMNTADSSQFSVTVPPAGAPDPRQIGIRPTGVYWGGAGEQIDLQSGNLNYTLPLVQAKGRGGLSATFALNYNSQMWRKDLSNNATWYYGRDNGYGHGWRLMSGSILPVYSDLYQVSQYIYTDSTGAEYRLDVNTNNVWTSKEGVFVSYDANTQRLYFNNGTFWLMGAESDGTEYDAGVRYPTLMQDSNGNQIGISYQTGVNAPYANSSSRIASVNDITGPYSFVYTGGRLTGINVPNSGAGWTFTYGTSTANSPWEPGQNPQNVVQALLTVNHGSGATHSFNYYATGEAAQVNLPYGGTMRWTYGEWTSSSQRIVREVNQRWLAASAGATETGHFLTFDAGDASREYHYNRVVADQSGTSDKVWWFNPDRTLGTFDERKLPAYTVTVRKFYSWARTPTSDQPYISQVDSTLELGTSNALTKRSIQNLDQYGNVILAKEYDYTLSETTARWYFTDYLTDTNYTSRYIRNRPTQTRMTVNGVTTVLATNLYDYGVSPVCGAFANYFSYPIVQNVTHHDDANYGQGFSYRGNLTSSSFPGGKACLAYDYLGVLQTKTDNNGTTTLTPDAGRQYAVPSAITANGYTTTLQWDSLFNPTTTTGPNSASAVFGWDQAGRVTSQTGPDGDSAGYSYSIASRVNTSTSGKLFTKTYLDGLGRTVKVEKGYNPTSTTSVVDSVVDTEYAPCACTPMGKMKRVSQPHRPTDPAVWTTYTYDELGRVLTVTHPPNSGTSGSSGTTTYLYLANTVKMTDPAGRWKKYTMDGFGNLVAVEEPKPSGGSYVTTYTYNQFNKLATVTMTRDGYSGTTPQASVTQTRTFTYGSDLRLATTTFPETPGVTQYSYDGDQLIWKQDYKGVRKYYYDAAKHLIRVERYPGGTGLSPAVPQDLNGRVRYYYDAMPIATDFQSTYLQGRLAATEFNCGASGVNCMYELYSYTRGGRLKKKRLQGPEMGNLEVSFEYDTEGKLQYMVYPSGKRIKYTYDDMARQTAAKDATGSTEVDVVNNLSYGAAGELKSMSWLANPTQWASQNWSFNNRLQMTNYTYTGPGGADQVNHSYLYSDTANDGKLWRRQDNLSGQVVEYGYDSIHRLASAGVVGGTGVSGMEWGQAYIYDGFGNMAQKTDYRAFQAPVSSPLQPTMNSATNGGGSGDPGDIDNRITSYSGETYAYGPDNKRVMKTVPGQGTNWYLWAGSMRLGTYQFTWNSGLQRLDMTVVKEDLYVAGRRVAPSDRLGSDLSGGVKLMPYGEDIANPPVAGDRTKFAAYHRDATGLDYADQRYYSPGTARFLNADPYIASGGAESPGSWNRYAYVEGDPVNYSDPDGLDRVDGTGSPLGWLGLLIPGFGGGIPGGYSSWEAYFDQLVTINIWKKNPGEQVKKWDLAIAAAIADASRQKETDEPFKHYPHHLQVIGDCYDRFGARIRTYEVRNEIDEIIAGGVVTQEYNYVTEGAATSINTQFRGARFNDNIYAGLQSGWTYYQQFSVEVTGLNATPGFVPIMVREMDGRDYGTLGVHIDKHGTVFINGNDGKVNGSPRRCP